MTQPESATFDAAVYKVQTLVDGGLRVTFDLSESAIDAAAWLMTAKRSGTPLHVACVVSTDEREEERRKAIK